MASHTSTRSVVWYQTFPIAIMYLIRYPFRMIHHDLMEKVLMIFGSKVFSMPLLFPSPKSDEKRFERKMKSPAAASKQQRQQQQQIKIDRE